MPRNFIKVNTSVSAATHAQLLLQYKTSMQQTRDLGARLLGIMNNNQDGSVWTDLEELFGLPPGTGQQVYNLVNGSVGAMNGTFQNQDCRTLVERVG